MKFPLSKLSIILVVLAFLYGHKTTAQSDLDAAIQLQYNYPDSAIALARAVQTKLQQDTISLSNSYEVIGIAHWNRGRWQEAIDAHYQAMQLREAVGFERGLAHSHNNLGLVYWKMRHYPKAIEHYHACLDQLETRSDTSLLSKTLGNIGILYQEQRDYDNALRFHQRSLRLFRQQNDRRSIANTLNNISLTQRQMGQYEQALKSGYESIQLYGQLNDKTGVALALNNLGLIYSDRNQLETADSLFEDALSVYQQRIDSAGLAMVLGNLGANAKSRGEWEQAIEWCSESYELAVNHGKTKYVLSACQCLADAFALSGDYERASAYLWEYIHLTDSISEGDSGREVALKQLRYESQKEQMRLALERERERTLAKAEIRRQKLLRNASVLIGVLILVVLVLLFIGFRRQQRANRLLKARNLTIVEQGRVIEQRSQEITESINYARRLQEARLPGREKFDSRLEQWHLLFRPKDNVSGDFYWLESIDGLIYLAVADCTGHGVPGAMVSMVGIQGLNEALFERRMRSPADILNFLDKSVKAAFMKDNNIASDGMDISLVCIDTTNGNFIFSGAYNPLLIISQRKSIPHAELKESELEWRMHEVKAQRYSIGELPDTEQFTNQIISFGPHDSVVLFSDGMADQFGGPKNKKFGNRQLRKTVFDAVIAGRFDNIDSVLDDWKAERDQLDDITLVCAKPALNTLKTD